MHKHPVLEQLEKAFAKLSVVQRALGVDHPLMDNLTDGLMSILTAQDLIGEQKFGKGDRAFEGSSPVRIQDVRLEFSYASSQDHDPIRDGDGLPRMHVRTASQLLTVAERVASMRETSERYRKMADALVADANADLRAAECEAVVGSVSAPSQKGASPMRTTT